MTRLSPRASQILLGKPLAATRPAVTLEKNDNNEISHHEL